MLPLWHAAGWEGGQRPPLTIKDLVDMEAKVAGGLSGLSRPRQTGMGGCITWCGLQGRGGERGRGGYGLQGGYDVRVG